MRLLRLTLVSPRSNIWVNPETVTCVYSGFSILEEQSLSTTHIDFLTDTTLHVIGSVEDVAAALQL